MQTAQMNSPRFSYQAAVPMAPGAPRTLDDFRPVHGSYAGSFSGKSSQPIWIAVGMIAVVASIAIGVNLYSASHTANIGAVVAPTQHLLVEPTAPAIATSATAPVEAPIAKEGVAGEVSAPATKNSEITTPPKMSVAAKPAPTVTRKTAPVPVEPVQMVAPPEVAPVAPPMIEPAPTPPLPIIIEKPITPAPAPIPDAPPAEPKP